MAWPKATDFIEAVQDLHVSMEDEELRGGEVARTPLGLPMLWSGNFADVFKVHCPATGNTWALKCFTREVRGLQDRYRNIAAHLEQARLPFTVDFQYLEQGIRIGGEWFPALKMRWVEGLTLAEFVEEHLERPSNLKMLLDLWVKLASRLREAEVAHADLQHGNVLLVPVSGGSFALRLVDYDGMFVPALAGTQSGEVGHPAYQHPQRLREGTYNAEVDRFSHLAIYCGIRCLMLGRRELWQRFNNGDNLLFREEDFRNPSESKLFRVLWKNLPDSDARALLGQLVLACETRLEEVPLLDEVVTDGKVLPLTFEEEAAISDLLSPPLKSFTKPASEDGVSLEWLTPSTGDNQSKQSVAMPAVPTGHVSLVEGIAKTALLAPLRAVDQFLLAIVGPDNTLLYNFLRIIAVAVPVLLVGWFATVELSPSAQIALEPLDLRPIPPQTIEAGNPLTMAMSVENADAWKGKLRYSLGRNVPSGACIDAQTGMLRWTTAEDQGVGNYDMVVSVETPDGRKDQTTFTVTVTRPIPLAPLRLQPIASQTVEVGKQLAVAVQVENAEQWKGKLRYSFPVGSPSGASIDPQTGAFTWTPNADQGPSTHDVAVSVDGPDGRKGQTTFTVAVTARRIEFFALGTFEVDGDNSEGNPLTIPGIPPNSEVSISYSSGFFQSWASSDPKPPWGAYCGDGYVREGHSNWVKQLFPGAVGELAGYYKDCDTLTKTLSTLPPCTFLREGTEPLVLYINPDPGARAHTRTNREGSLVVSIEWRPVLLPAPPNQMEVRTSRIKTSLADSVSDFSTTQGNNGWYYGCYQFDHTTPKESPTFQPLSYSTKTPNRFGYDRGPGWWLGQQFWTSMWKEGWQPHGGYSQSVEHWPVRRWMSNVSGPVTIRGKLFKVDPHPDGDGVIAYIFLDGQQVWRQSLRTGDTVGAGYSVDVAVHIGAILDFAIAPGENDGWDGTNFTASILAKDRQSSLQKGLTPGIDPLASSLVPKRGTPLRKPGRGDEPESPKLDPSKPQAQNGPEDINAIPASRPVRTRDISIDLGGGVKLEMALIPAGEFLMGSPDSDKDANPSEKPQHRVRITKPFYLGKYLVTQEQWEAVMGDNPSNFKGPKNPVEQISWDNCQQFFDKLNAMSHLGGGKFQLPTEAQWEYTCRAGRTTRYCFGDEESGLGKYAWYFANTDSKTYPVGEKKPNAWGLYDMHGNVWESCQDWYDSGYYAKSPADDPTGPATGSLRVYRGGSWAYTAGYCRSANRVSYVPAWRICGLGFRVARVLAEKSGAPAMLPVVTPDEKPTPTPTFHSAIPNSQSKLPAPSRAVAPFDNKQASEHQESRAKALGVPVETSLDLGLGVALELALIPAGSFMMGDEDEKAYNNERPVHKVTITKPFGLGKYNVTQEQWKAVMGDNPSYCKGPKNPVEQVSWEHCQTFLENLNQRFGTQGGRFQLPTEAQWEYACRAGSTTRYCFGDDAAQLGVYAWCSVNSGRTTHPVGQKKPNAWGLFDMHGNVWEWCADWYDSSYSAASPVDDPPGPASGWQRVLRGGSWNNGADRCRSAARLINAPGGRSNYLGFRVARVAAE